MTTNTCKCEKVSNNCNAWVFKFEDLVSVRFVGCLVEMVLIKYTQAFDLWRNFFSNNRNDDNYQYNYYYHDDENYNYHEDDDDKYYYNSSYYG